MNQLISKSLSEIVNEQFQTASVFEKYHLDYYCKGSRSLQQACEEENVPVNKIIEDIKNIYARKTNALDFNAFSLCQLSEYIEYTHHGYIKKVMPEILSYLEKVASKYGSRYN